MKIIFRTGLSARLTECFEDQYEESLQLPREDKDEILQKGLSVWMFVDGKIAGESYGICPADLDEEIEDIADKPSDVFYIYSLTLLPEYRGKGLAKILTSYLLGMAHEYKTITAHATTDAVVAIMKTFGAEVTTKHERWYDTERTAWFCTIQN
jgi:ribosomal protein S18 acetylase RimI-like enzyme